MLRFFFSYLPPFTLKSMEPRLRISGDDTSGVSENRRLVTIPLAWRVLEDERGKSRIEVLDSLCLYV